MSILSKFYGNLMSISCPNAFTKSVFFSVWVWGPPPLLNNVKKLQYWYKGASLVLGLTKVCVGRSFVNNTLRSNCSMYSFNFVQHHPLIKLCDNVYQLRHKIHALAIYTRSTVCIPAADKVNYTQILKLNSQKY